MEANMSVWADTGVFLQGIGTVAGALAVIVAAVLGANSVSKWRAQKITDRMIDQAERIVVAAYGVRRDLYNLRSPFLSARELDEAENQLIDGPGLTLEGTERKKIIVQQVYYNRLNAAYENRRQLFECQAMARALFGEELELAIETLGSQFGIVQSYIDLHQHFGPVDDLKFQKEARAAMTRGLYKEDNEIDREIAKQVKIIEDTCIPVLRIVTKNK
ncbi:hypothetical protein [Agrobacterium deltaense]|uniref:hypothetical protein n=1 Tax=Agrobacterium deltaense TaxID=1183412 RepID=UPI001C6E90A7|nr:hypothetical protein [Agrobacterium deltaense]MBW9072191.1 hypothetical protein [Agrobacterium deltaense]